MSGSAIRNSLMLSPNHLSTAGKASFAAPQSKNVSSTRSRCRAIGGRYVTRTVLLQQRDVGGAGEALLLELVQRAVGGQRPERVIDAPEQRVALLEEHPELLRVAALLLGLPDDRGLRD